MPAPPAAVSGGPPTPARTGSRSTVGCHGWPSGRWPPTRGTVRSGSARGEANNASENQYGVGIYRLARGSATWQRGGRLRVVRRRRPPDRLDPWPRLRRDQPRAVPPLRQPPRRSAAWRPVLQPAGPVDYPPSSRGHRCDRAAGHPGGARSSPWWVGRATPIRRRPSTTASTSAPAVAAASPGSLRPATINPATIGRTTLSTSGGWLYAVLTDTTTGDLSGDGGAFVSRSGRAQGPWQRIADVDKLHNSDSALGAVDQQLLPGRPSGLQPVHPRRPRDRDTSTCSWRRSSSPPTAAPPGWPWARTGTSTSAARRRAATRTTAR